MSFREIAQYVFTSLSIYVFKSVETFFQLSSIASSFDFAQKYASEILLI
jgi:hypothetical protein